MFEGYVDANLQHNHTRVAADELNPHNLSLAVVIVNRTIASQQNAFVQI